MRRITMWITATIAAFALMLSYQLNASGATGKAEGGDHQPPAVVSTESGAATPSTDSTGGSTDSGKTGVTNNSTGKPGEGNK
ncbi:hypothetical protein ABZS66_38215 [Dactylosporangium sp. NPDC005572]|uniref:hypothetical protein n=1 Tax=Dactylosporangium sp. NPDC005572 TaxID=3156889 RepID=UPI0033B11123